MISRLARLGIVFLAIACAQQSKFEVASVRPFDPATRPPWIDTGGPGSKDPGRIHFPRAIMLTLLTRAYGVGTDQISGPAWIRDFTGKDYYTVDATMPPGTTKEQYRQMLQNLLAERFRLKVHHETRSFPGYELTVAKGGPKMKESEPDHSPPPDPDAPMKMPAMGKDGFLIMPPGSRCVTVWGTGSEREKCQQRTMAEFAENLGNELRVALGSDQMDSAAPTPRVADKTGLTAKYDFILEFACYGCRGLKAIGDNLPVVAMARQRAEAAGESQASDPDFGGLPTIFHALEKQMGLKLEKTNDVSVDVIVIDHIERAPVGN